MCLQKNTLTSALTVTVLLALVLVSAPDFTVSADTTNTLYVRHAYPVNINIDGIIAEGEWDSFLWFTDEATPEFSAYETNDDSYFYLAVVIEDPTPLTEDNDDIWIAFRDSNDNYQEFRKGFTSDPEKYGQYTTTPYSSSYSELPNGTQFAFSIGTSSIYYEWKIPLSVLNAKPGETLKYLIEVREWSAKSLNYHPDVNSYDAFNHKEEFGNLTLNPYSSIQGAIDAAAAGGTILINPGTYTEDITISKAVNLVGIADEDGAKPVITGSALPTSSSDRRATLKITGAASSNNTSIKNLAFKVPEELKQYLESNSGFYYSILIDRGISNITIEGCEFDDNDTLVFDQVENIKRGANAIDFPYGKSGPVTVDGCHFKGYYVAIDGYVDNLTVKNSTFEKVKAGINVQQGNNLNVENSTITVLPRITWGDSYAVRFADDGLTISSNMNISNSQLVITSSTAQPEDEKTRWSALWIRSKASGDLGLEGTTLVGEVVNNSTATLYASGNYWGSDKGPFTATFAGNGPIVIENWLNKDRKTVDLVSGAEKVPAHGSTGVAWDAQVKIVFPDNASITVLNEDNVENIGIKSENGSSLADVTATLNGNTVVITHPTFAYGTKYTVNVPGNTFAANLAGKSNIQVLAKDDTEWSFTTAAAPLPPVIQPTPPTPPTPPPGGAEPLPDEDVQNAIQRAEDVGVVELTAPQGENTLALTSNQVGEIRYADMPLVAQIGNVQVVLPPEVVKGIAKTEAAQLEIKVNALQSKDVEKVLTEASNTNAFKLASSVYEIKVELLNEDGERSTLDKPGAAVKLYLPVPKDNQDMAAAGLLTGTWYNETDKVWEELPSTYDASTKSIIVETTHLSKYAVMDKTPVVDSTEPANNATNIDINKPIKVTFSESVTAADKFSAITLKDSSGSTLAITATISGNVLTLTPSSDLVYGTKYTVTIPAGAVKDSAGNLLAEDFSFNFTTKVVPTVVSTEPANGATNAAIDKPIKITFTEDVLPGDNFDAILMKDASGATLAITATITASVLTITPSDLLAYSASYSVTIPAGAVKNAAGNSLPVAVELTFTTMAAPDTTAPTVVSTDPADGASDVALDKAITVTFSENVVEGDNFGDISVKDAEGQSIDAKVTVTGSVITITPSTQLDYSTKYTVTIPAGAVKDTSGNALAEEFSFSFTTQVVPTVVSTDPANGAVDVPVDKVIKVTFNKDVVEGDAFANIVLKDAAGQKVNTKVELSGSVLTISPSNKLDYSTKYTVVIPAGAVKDAAGNSLEDEYTFSFTTVSFPTKTFDDIQGHWAQHDIEIMAGLGIAKGVGDNKFNPDASITRAEFVALLVRSIGISAEPVSETSFKDVAPDAWYAAEVEAAHKAGIAIGFEDGTFRPYAKVTREQIAAFIVRAMSWTVEEEEVDSILSKFTDQAKISSWALKEVAAAAQKGIVLGRPNGAFDPQANTTRAEALVMLKRMLQVTGMIPQDV